MFLLNCWLTIIANLMQTVLHNFQQQEKTKFVSEELPQHFSTATLFKLRI